MTDKDRIKQYLKYKGISKNKFYSQTGLSVGFLDSGRSLGLDKVRIIINVYNDISLEWLVTGFGNMIHSERPQAVMVEQVKVDELEEFRSKNIELEREITRLHERIATQQDCISLIIKNLAENSGGGNLHGLLSAKSPASPIDLTNICRDMVDPR